MICFLHRWSIDRTLDEGAPLDDSTTRHVARCANCRDHHEQQRTVNALLEQSAATPTPAAPDFLRSRVMHAVRAEQAESLPVRWGIAAWAPVAVVTAIAMVGILQNPSLPNVQSNVWSNPNANPPVAEAPAKLPALPTTNLQAAFKKIPDQIVAPYDQELQNLQIDLKSAGQYLGGIVGLKFAANE